MGIEEIRQVCINGSEVYYNYLRDNKKGIQEIQVQKIEAVHKGIFSIKIAQMIFDTDALYFRLLDNDEVYDTNTIRVVEYDRDAKLLVIRVPQELSERFSQLHKNDLQIFSDLKFLVQRVREWYEMNGGSISLPQSESVLSKTIDELKFFNDSKPSEHQIAAIKSVFTQPFTYVWGAPGTGKTQFVLAYSILHYLNKGKRVAIFGPTNNAIEQVLRGVIKMTDKAGIDRKKILRLGGPSKKFAEDFPEVCEEHGLLKKIREHDAQIEIIRKVLGQKKPSERLLKLRASKSMLNLLETESTLLSSLLNEQVGLKGKLILLSEGFETSKKSLQEAQLICKRAQRKANSIFNKVLKRIYSENESEADLQVRFAFERVEELENTHQQIASELLSRQGEEKNLMQQINGIQSKLSNLLSDVNNALEFFSIDLKVSDAIHKSELLPASSALDELISEEEGTEKIKGVLAENYKTLSVEQLEAKIQEHERQIESLKSRTTEERIKDVAIIAATLDCYIGRFSQAKLDVDHLFLDEAGYANIAKALTLFNHQKPITFLGDHMQLPPVCEFKQSEIMQNVSNQDVFVWSQSSIYIESLFGSTNKQQNLTLFGNALLPPFHSHKKTDLVKTFRFANNLARVLDQKVYGNGFHSDLQIGDTKIYFVDAQQVGRPSVRWSNPAEAQQVLHLVEQLPKNTDFVILCPYKRQIDLISQGKWELKTEQKILTVHGSQGREWNTVILSVVDDFNDLFLMDANNRVSRGLNLINTAVSRAKKELIIVCNHQFWLRQNGQLLRDLLLISESYKVKSSLYV